MDVVRADRDGRRVLRLGAQPAARSGDLGDHIHALTGNIVTLLGGIVVFHDPIGNTPAQIVARITAFGLVILGAALLPERLRAGATASAENHPPIAGPTIAVPQRATS